MPKSKAAGASDGEPKAKKDTEAKAPKGKVKAAAGKKSLKAKRGKVVRDSFTMPKSEYMLIDALKQKCLALGVAAKKSELLRAGLSALNGMPGESLTQSIQALQRVKSGRPPGKK